MLVIVRTHDRLGIAAPERRHLQARGRRHQRDLVTTCLQVRTSIERIDVIHLAEPLLFQHAERWTDLKI